MLLTFPMPPTEAAVEVLAVAGAFGRAAELRVVRGEGEGADAADGVDAGPRIPGVKFGRFERGQRLAGRHVPHDHMADLVAGGQQAAVIGKSAGVEHRAEVVWRLRLMAAQLVLQLRAPGLPHAADHVVRHAGDELAVPRRDDVANPAVVRLEGAHLLARLGMPPDELPVVRAGNDLVPRDRDAGDVAGVPCHPGGLGLFLPEIEVVDAAVGAAGKDALRLRHERDAEQDVLSRDLLRDFEFGGIEWHLSVISNQ